MDCDIYTKSATICLRLHHDSGNTMSVTFGDDTLSGSTIADLFAYIKGQESEFTWNSNFLLWESVLSKAGGAVLTHQLGADRTGQLFAELYSRGKLDYRPSQGTALFYAWFSGSNITWHYDYVKKAR